VHHWLLFQKYTSIKHIVYIHLRNFLGVYTKDEKILWIKKGKVPLYQDTDSTKILYISSVALQVYGADVKQSTLFINDFAAYLATSCSELFRVKIAPPAWIHIEITDSTLADWLNFLINEKPSLQGIGDWEQGTGINENNQLLFTVQYTHARCYSLIRLANREGLIKLRTSVGDDESLIFAESIPWLDCNQKLRLLQADEVRLLHLLVKTVDDLVFPDSGCSVNWITAALNICDAFESFWCNCRIWGEVKINSLELAQARLGLLLATQLVLKSVLQSKLGVFAPLEL
jgi:hypothetical protein